jgi:hypothetical protein
MQLNYNMKFNDNNRRFTGEESHVYQMSIFHLCGAFEPSRSPARVIGSNGARH